MWCIVCSYDTNTLYFLDPLSMRVVLQYALDMTEGVLHMHKHAYIHNDIAARNFLLQYDVNDFSKKQRVIISDYGLAFFTKVFLCDLGVFVCV